MTAWHVTDDDDVPLDREHDWRIEGKNETETMEEICEVKVMYANVDGAVSKKIITTLNKQNHK